MAGFLQSSYEIHDSVAAVVSLELGMSVITSRITVDACLPAGDDQ